MSFLDTYQRAGGGLTPDEADAYVAEQVRAAELVGLAGASVPSSVAQMEAYLTAVRAELVCTRDARDVARFLLFPPMPAPVRLLTPALPAWAGVSGLAFALLPSWARRAYGLRGLRVTDAQATLAVRALRAGLAVLPERVRKGPHLRAAEDRLTSRPA